MGRVWKWKSNSWTLDKKIYAFTTCLVYVISIIMLAVFTAFYFSSFISRSDNITKNQLSAMATNYEYTFNSYKELAEALIIDDAIQEFVESSGQGDEKYFSLVNNAKNTLQNAINMNSHMNFIAIISYNSDDILYKGSISKISTNFKKVYKSDYTNSIYCSESGTLRMSFNNVYLNKQNMLNVYMPIYSISKMINEIGLLCMIFDSSIFDGLPESSIMDSDSEVLVVDGAKTIVSCTNTDMIGTKFEFAEMLNKTSASFRKNNNLYSYQKIGNWNYYLISRIPLINMYRNSIMVVLLLISISVAVTYFGLAICKRIIGKAYQPLDNVIKAMNCAAEGKLDVRVNMENVGIDFVKLAYGFNYMMGKINTLMEQVKLEQHQKDQIRFNALQSQIQPHFLYNTLECIHWQAMADGNEEISVLVKALAQYYRLCLSNGKDIIRLEQEIEHVRNYLIIQNIRYDNIINSVIEIEENCRDILIPKITLQPLVENSIYHGIKVKEGRSGKLRIAAHKEGEDVFIVVEDNGTGMTEEQIRKMNNSISEYDKDFGYGIRNVNKRIEILFGKEYGLHYEKNKYGGVTVIIRLPSNEVRKYEEVL